MAQETLVEIAIILVLILLNGLFALSEMAVVSSRHARLVERAQAGARGYAQALDLAESPGRFLSTVQVGITLVGVLLGDAPRGIWADKGQAFPRRDVRKHQRHV